MPDAPAPAATSLLCDRCGAPLAVGPRARYVTCAHCGARLGVHRTDSAAWTETLEEVAAATGRIEAKLDALAVGPRLKALEREWTDTRRQLSRRTGRGRWEPPTRKAAEDEARGWRILGVIMGLAIALGTGLAGPTVGEAVIGLTGAVVAGGTMCLVAAAVRRDGARRVAQYAAAERDYLRRWSALTGEPPPPGDAAD